ncbi:MAG: type II secretion system protein [Candidatus Aminicenantes bacterium]|nr:type II secretion system protein [Candidatus Aminicenantes bacterium]
MAIRSVSGPWRGGRASSPLRNGGYVMITLIIAIAVLTVFMLMAVPLWQTAMQREAEEELIFRGRQYVTAIGRYLKKHNNLYAQNLQILHLEKFLRRLYKDPMTDDGRWDMVFQDNSTAAPKLLVVPPEQAKAYVGRAVLIGVCSSSPETGFREYRGKKKYNEWAFYFGGKENEDMPELHYVGR